MGTLERKWGPFGDPKTEKGPHGDPGPQMGTHLGAVLLAIFLVDPLRLLLRITLKAVFTSLKEVLGSVSRYPARMEEEVEDLFPV